MPNYRRARTKGGIYFFTVVTHNRKPIFINPASVDTLRSIMRVVSKELAFEEIACVILPDHIHAIWELPQNDDDYSKRWGVIKARFTKVLRAYGPPVGRALPDITHKRSTPPFEIWQKRFWEHQIRDQTDLNNHIDYIHYNPIKHGYVKNVSDWKYSTFHRFIKAGSYPKNWGANVTLRSDIEYGG